MSEGICLVGHLLGFGCGNFMVFHEFKLCSFFQVVFDGNGEGIATSVKGEIHGVAFLQVFSNSFLVRG